MIVILEPLNGMLASAGTQPYAAAQAAVEAADTVRDAVEGVGILNGQTDEVVVEARALLDALPAAVDEAIIAALESAFERGVPVFLGWLRDDSATIEARVFEEPVPGGDGVRVRIDVVSPHGSLFV